MCRLEKNVLGFAWNKILPICIDLVTDSLTISDRFVLASIYTNDCIFNWLKHSMQLCPMEWCLMKSRYGRDLATEYTTVHVTVDTYVEWCTLTRGRGFSPTVQLQPANQSRCSVRQSKQRVFVFTSIDRQVTSCTDVYIRNNQGHSLDMNWGQIKSNKWSAVHSIRAVLARIILFLLEQQ